MTLKKFISKVLILTIFVSLISIKINKFAYADAFKVVTLGADLTDTQKKDMLKYFNVGKEDANILEVTSSEEGKYLNGIATKKQLGTKSISCSYVEPTDKDGLKIYTHNLYWVTDSMIKNALITAGIENAIVKASAPFRVSGTAALTGILKGFENSKNGQKIDENKKEAASQEIVVTGDLGEKIGQDEAASLINQVKKDIIKEKPKTSKEIQNIVLNITNSFNKDSDKKLNNKDIQKISSLMNKINKLDINFNEIKDQLNNVTKQLKNTLTSKQAQSILDKIFNFLGDLFNSIGNFFKNLFSDNTSNTQSETVNDKIPSTNTTNPN